MKQKLKEFLSDSTNCIGVIITVVLVQIIYVCPITLYKSDSSFLWYDTYCFSAFGSGRWEYLFRLEPDSDLEIIAFTDTGEISIDESEQFDEGCTLLKTTVSQLRTSTMHPISETSPLKINWGVPESFKRFDAAYADEVGISNGINFDAAKSYTSYIGFIFKKNGRIVGSELYKMYSPDNDWWLVVKPIVIMEYPSVSGRISEFAVYSNLQQIAMVDRIITLNSITELSLSDLSDWFPPYSPTYNP